MNAHGLRVARLLLAPVALVAALALPGHAAAAPTLRNADSLENPLVAEINKLRASKGLRKLRVVPALTKAATRHARSMGESGYFRHELRTPKQSSFWTPFGTWIRWYYAQPGVSSWTAGENLAWGAPSLSAQKTVEMWMSSKPHRENLLRPGWHEIGVAVVAVQDPTNVYKDSDRVAVVAAEFGARR